jgi:endonuclease/exonuclease/phosphatase (EEP) superfamily protein YafD
MRQSSTTFQRLSLLALLAISIALVLGFLGPLHQAFDEFSHFLAHLAVLLALLALPLFATGSRIEAVVALVFALGAFATTTDTLPLPRFSPVQAGFETGTDDRAVYHLLQMNLRFDNPTPEKVLSLIGRTQPDVITLNEVSDMWKAKLALLAKSYPHRIICPVPDGVYRVAILSRRPFAEGTRPHCYDRGALAIATVDFGGTAVDVAALHIGWPWPFEQRWQVRELSMPLRLLGQTALLACDCNAAPWSATVRRVAGDGGLTLMPSVGRTWQYIKLPDFLRFAGLPIDQVFSKGTVLVHSGARLEDTGSDHLPVLVAFSLRPAADPSGDEEEAVTAVAAAAVQANGSVPHTLR